MARSVNAFKEVIVLLKKAARRLGLVINEAKTKYMHVGSNIIIEEQHMKNAPYKFKIVNEFSYLESLINSENKGILETQEKNNGC